MPSPYTVGYCMPTALYSIYATVGLHVTVPRMPVRFAAVWIFKFNGEGN